MAVDDLVVGGDVVWFRWWEVVCVFFSSGWCGLFWWVSMCLVLVVVRGFVVGWSCRMLLLVVVG